MRLLKKIFFGLLLLLVVTVGIAFVPGVQKAVFLRVANAGEFTVAVDDFRLRPGGLSLAGLQAAGPAGGLSLERFQVNSSLLQLVRGRVHLDDVTIRGLEIRLTDSREPDPEKTPFSLDEIRETLAQFQGILPGLEPDLALRTLTLEGKITLPDQEQILFSVTGGGLGRGQSGTFAIDLKWGDDPQNSLGTLQAQLAVALGERGDIREVSLRGEAAHSQPMLPSVLRLDVSLRSDREGENYMLRITTDEDENLLALEGSWRPTPGLLELAGEARLPQELSEQGQGEAAFRLAARTRDGVLHVELQSVGEWLDLPEVLAVDAAELTASLLATVDLQTNRVSLDDLQATVSGNGAPRPWVSAQLTEAVQIDFEALDQLPQRSFLSLELDLPQALLQAVVPALAGGDMLGAWSLAGQEDSLILSATQPLSFSIAADETPLNPLQFSGSSQLRLSTAEAKLELEQIHLRETRQAREIRGNVRLSARNWMGEGAPVEAALQVELQEANKRQKIELEAALTPPVTEGGRPSLQVDSLRMDLDLPSLQSFFLRENKEASRPGEQNGPTVGLPQINLPLEVSALSASVRIGLAEKARVEATVSGNNLAAGKTGEISGEVFFYRDDSRQAQLDLKFNPRFDAAGDLRHVRGLLTPVELAEFPAATGWQVSLQADWARPQEWLSGVLATAEKKTLLEWRVGMEQELQGALLLLVDGLEEYLPTPPAGLAGIAARGNLTFSQTAEGWTWQTREPVIISVDRVELDGLPALRNASVRLDIDQGALGLEQNLLTRLALTANIGEIPVFSLAGELDRADGTAPVRLRGSGVADVSEWRKTPMVALLPNLQRGLFELRADFTGEEAGGLAGTLRLDGRDLARLDGFEVYGFSLEGERLQLTSNGATWQGGLALQAGQRRTLARTQARWTANTERPRLDALVQGQTIHVVDLQGFQALFEQSAQAVPAAQEDRPLNLDFGMDAKVNITVREVVLPEGQPLQDIKLTANATADQVRAQMTAALVGGQFDLRPELRQEGEQVVLDLTGSFRNLPVERLLAPPEQLRSAPLTGNFSGDWVFAARGKTADQLMDSLTGSLQIEGRSGVLRALKPGDRVTRLAGAGSVAGSVLGRALGRPALAALGDIIPLLSEVPYQSMQIRADRLADQTIRLDSLQFLGSYLFLGGGGTIGPAPFAELKNARLDLLLMFGAKPPLAGPLDTIGALTRTPNPQGYLSAREPLRVRGTVGSPNAEELWEKLIALVERAATMSEADLRRERERQDAPDAATPAPAEPQAPASRDPLERGVNRLIDILGR